MLITDLLSFSPRGLVEWQSENKRVQNQKRLISMPSYDFLVPLSATMHVCEEDVLCYHARQRIWRIVFNWNGFKNYTTLQKSGWNRRVTMPWQMGWVELELRRVAEREAAVEWVIIRGPRGMQGLH